MGGDDSACACGSRVGGGAAAAGDADGSNAASSAAIDAMSSARPGTTAAAASSTTRIRAREPRVDGVAASHAWRGGTWRTQRADVRRRRRTSVRTDPSAACYLEVRGVEPGRVEPSRRRRAHGGGVRERAERALAEPPEPRVELRGAARELLARGRRAARKLAPQVARDRDEKRRFLVKVGIVGVADDAF